jgi:hypothetical protein
VCFLFFAREAAGAPCARHFLRPLDFEGRDLAKTRAQFALRECWFTSLRSESDEAIQSFDVATFWIASLSLAMTWMPFQTGR